MQALAGSRVTALCCSSALLRIEEVAGTDQQQWTGRVMCRRAMYDISLSGMLMCATGQVPAGRPGRVPGAPVQGAAQILACRDRTGQRRTVTCMQRFRLLLVQRVANSKAAASLCCAFVFTRQTPLTWGCPFMDE